MYLVSARLAGAPDQAGIARGKKPTYRLTSAIAGREHHLGIGSSEHQGAGPAGVPIFREVSRPYCYP
ncbi:hypothetical protein [Arboricoccus pini]|uniref:hypothetical protein n=1 Tax=Arboricoccus pini TaxID=1963835 RepID=UPI001056DC71|nr:hypothetical protein [Arboricoccus pini]